MNIHTKWNCLIPILSGLVKYRSVPLIRPPHFVHYIPPKVGGGLIFEDAISLDYKRLLFTDIISGNNTTVPRLISEHFLQNENKHQIMNVHTKWNCLIPIFVYFGQVLAVPGPKTLVTSDRYCKWYNTTVPRLISEHSLQNENKHQIYECTHQMELFDTNFVYLGQVLAVPGPKTLVTSDRYCKW